MNLNLTVLLIAALTIIVSLSIPEYIGRAPKRKRNVKKVKQRKTDLFAREIRRVGRGGKHT